MLISHQSPLSRVRKLVWFLRTSNIRPKNGAPKPQNKGPSGPAFATRHTQKSFSGSRNRGGKTIRTGKETQVVSARKGRKRRALPLPGHSFPGAGHPNWFGWLWFCPDSFFRLTVCRSRKKREVAEHTSKGWCGNLTLHEKPMNIIDTDCTRRAP